MATADTSVTDVWHVESDGERKGPVSEADVLGMIARKQLRRDNLGWKPGMKDWQPLGDIPGLEAHFHGHPPPLAASAVPNGLVWALAFAPLIGEFIAGFLFAITASPAQQAIAEQTGDYTSKYWWVTLALNVVLSYLDERKLKKNGYETKGMGPAFIVPFYLYKRAAVLKQRPSYFIVWMICFFGILFFI